jgi:putative nucleotidyltransferase with HDIG domain
MKARTESRRDPASTGPPERGWRSRIKLDTTFLESRVALKLFLVVSLGALLPIVGLGLATFQSVSGHLEERAEEQLSLASREAANAMVERIRISVERIEQGGDTEKLERTIATTQLQRDILARNDFVITEAEGRLVVGLPGDRSDVGWYWLDQPFLFWGSFGEAVSSSSRLDVFLPDGRSLIEHENALNSTRRISQRIQQSDITGEPWWGAGFTLPAQYGGLRIVISEPTEKLLAPLNRFRQTFPLVVATTLVLALLTTVVLVRKILTPLERLKEATLRLADQDFETRVEISSGDEFEELADSFNQMTLHLGQQFKTLVRINDLGRVALSKFTPEEIIESVLDQIDDALDCEWSSFMLFQDDDRAALRYSRVHNGGAEIATGLRCLSSDEFDLTPALRSEDILLAAKDTWAWAAPSGTNANSLAIFPISANGRLGAVIAVGFIDDPERLKTSAQPLGRRAGEFGLARMVADQVGVALANADLVGGLERLSLGTLLALARAVDAKSPWTRGHSERVARVGQMIGEAMGCDEATLDVLYRGGLLHDIGKIGIPARILDKEGKLSPRERDIMRSHPELGVKILEPIPGFENILPIVAQHHERIDGLGYPRGLRGNEISRFARIFAVADVFDALASDRPYRPGMAMDRVVSILEEGSGTHFDPEVLAAFRSILPTLEYRGLASRFEPGEPENPTEPLEAVLAS